MRRLVTRARATSILLATATGVSTPLDGDSTIRVPRPSGLSELRTRTGIRERTAGAIDSGCSTRAPYSASSAASAKETSLNVRAEATRRGSALIKPSTSVQIWISSASSAIPSTAAVVSEPPRPSVVVCPSRLAPMNPPTIGRAPRVRSGVRQASHCSRTRGGSGVAAPKRSSVATSCCGSTRSAGKPSSTKAASTMRAESLSPWARTRSRTLGVPSPRIRTERSCCRNESNNRSTSSPSWCRAAGSSTQPPSAQRCLLSTSASSGSSPSRSPCCATRYARSSRSVTAPRADTTTTGRRSIWRLTISATARIRWASASELPPNFITIKAGSFSRTPMLYCSFVRHEQTGDSRGESTTGIALRRIGKCRGSFAPRRRRRFLLPALRCLVSLDRLRLSHLVPQLPRMSELRAGALQFETAPLGISTDQTCRRR